MLVLLPAPVAEAFRVYIVPEVPDLTAGGVLRWNAAPHTVEGVERSLDGGLRYSIQGGNYTAFRELFQWEGPTPSVAQVQLAVENSFAAWEAVDPESGLATDLYFVPDFGTFVVIEPAPVTLEDRARLNRGAEIDIGAASLPGDGIGSSYSFGDPALGSVTLTSGTPDYQSVINSGSDILLSSAFSWSLSRFQATLTHEIGHALGLGDVDVIPSANPFNSLYYDDNYDDSSEATMLATLTNSFANVIDPYDPDNSLGLSLFEPCGDASDPTSPLCTGIDVPGVDILMETSPQVVVGTPQNDDFAARQFLYPYVPLLAGDFDGDGDVDGNDFLAWQRNPTVGELSDWQANYGGVGSLGEVAIVPEPATVLLLLGVANIGLCRQRPSAPKPEFYPLIGPILDQPKL